MEDSCKIASEINPAPEDTDTTAEVTEITSSTPSAKGVGISSQTLFPESPVYEPDEEMDLEKDTVIIADDSISEPKVEQTIVQAKRKLSDEGPENSAKVLKLDCVKDDDINTLTLDEEVSKITENPVIDLELPSTSRLRTPIRSSPRKITKRSNSSEVKPRTPRTPKVRAASADITKERKTPRKINLKLLKTKFIIEEENILKSENSKSRPSVEFVREIPPPIKKTTDIEENSAELNDSQNLHLVLSPSMEENESVELKTRDLSSDVIMVTDRQEILDPGKIGKSHSEGYAYSDESNNLSQPKPKECIKDKNTDQESTDTVCSMSPDHVPTVASKMISKLSNGNSSTPTELPAESKNITDDSDVTPDMVKLNRTKGKKGKNESFKSNTTTPSTISPLQNGHSLPIATPQIPVFDVHVCNSEEGEFLSLYIVRTDNELGLDMCKEYQRLSKRYTIDPYLADVSTSNSPSSVTSGGMINLPNRTSYASTVSSTSTSSNRTSDGTFVVPQAPRKSVSNPTTTVKGYDGLMRKLQDIFSHIREYSIDEGNRSSSDDKVSVGVQVLPSSESTNSLSNGNASPEEMSKCDKTTPKSSLKKSKVRGRRPLIGKTKRTILPTQAEEPEFMHGMNSPEMVPMNGDGDKSPVKSPKDEKPPPALVGTPKSVIKLKQKRAPTSPRPATPVEKSMMKQEFPGYTPDTVVLAKWVDKRYYSGKVLEITEPNKYLIKFDDGQSKVLLDEFIIFGDTKRLPLKGQSVYAMVDEEQTYEPGLVLDVEENDSGTVMYRCTTDGDTVVMVTGSELYLTEDQARSLKESARARSPTTPTTPRNARRHHRELDLDNIIQGPRSARSRDKGSSSAKKRVMSPKSPKASTSGLKTTKMATPTPSSRKRVASESSELSESSNSAPPARIEEVAGVEPEVQRTPRKIDGVKAGPLQLKGAAKQNPGKKNSKLAKFENDEHTISTLGPIPGGGSALFAGHHFLLTCADTPHAPGRAARDKESQDARQYSSEEDGEAASVGGTDTEDLEFTSRPFNKERLKAQIEAGGGIVHSHFDDVPAGAYSACHLVAPRPCLTAKYILCLAAGVRAVSHAWLVTSCLARRLLDVDAFALPAGWSVLAKRFIDWARDTPRPLFFKDKTILLCGEQDTFVKFWERVCSLVGACTRVVNDQDLNMSGAYALVTEWDCPHEVQNKANQEGVPLVSTVWVVQCLIESRVIPPASHEKFSFMYTEPE